MKIIAGHSTDNSISFASKRAKITLYDNYKVEYLPFLEKEKNSKKKNRLTLEEKIKTCDKNSFRARYLLLVKKIVERYKVYYPREDKTIVHKMHMLEYMFLIFEIFFMIYGKINNNFIFSLIPAIGLWIFAFTLVIRAIVSFSKNKRLRKIHGAEHMTYNASTFGIVDKDNILKRSRYCRHCGSVKPANFFFIETINLVIAFIFNLWIPHTLVLFFAMNIYSSLPLNFFAYFYQKFLTAEPDEEDVFLAYLCYEILWETDLLIGKNIAITPLVLKTVMAHSAKHVLSNNNFNIKNPYV